MTNRNSYHSTHDRMGCAPAACVEREILDERAFRSVVSLERLRSERSQRPFLLLLLNLGANSFVHENKSASKDLFSALWGSSRETDTIGWYQGGSALGMLFIEIETGKRGSIASTLTARVRQALRESLTAEQFRQITLSVFLFPDDWEQDEGTGPGNPALYPELVAREESRKSLRVVKRLMDIAGSLAAITFLSPVLLAIAVAIKLTSKGPVFFRQHRVGQFGQPFALLKFRSMYENSSSQTHKAYVRKLIAGVADKHPTNGNGRGVYKLTRDARVTRIGGILRRTSLDELPQLFNVLKGEMSLVGPRPPIDYEVEAYELWHRRRLLEAKPGITGLWQVRGRNRIKFDDMVRLDLEYARIWSPWLDLKIILLTPKAVIEGAH